MNRRSALLLAVLIIVPRASAQSLWTELSVLGLGAGVYACRDCDLESGPLVAALGMGAGMFAGFGIGHSAESALSEGRGLSQAQLLGARLGTVSGFAALGAIAAAQKISSQDDNEPGEDERTFTTYTAIGASCGVIYEVFVERRLASSQRWPALRLGPMPVQAGEGPALGVTLHRSW